MSAGRKGASLADLQGLADDGFTTAVRKFLLGEEAPAGPLADAPLAPMPEALNTADVPRELLSNPADWKHRTTPRDMRVLACALACERLPEKDAPLVRRLALRKALPSDYRFDKGDFDRVRAMLTRCYKDVLREIASRPARKRKTARMPARESNSGQNSHVVRKFRTGAISVNGVLVSAEQAQDVLRTIGAR